VARTSNAEGTERPTSLYGPRRKKETETAQGGGSQEEKTEENPGIYGEYKEVLKMPNKDWKKLIDPYGKGFSQRPTPEEARKKRQHPATPGTLRKIREVFVNIIKP